MRRCYCILLSLNRFRRHFSTEALITIIRAHVFSQILYCPPLWGGASQQQLYRIQKVINFAAPVVTGVKRRDHITPALNSLHWSRIGQLVEERVCLKVYHALRSEHTMRTKYVISDAFVRDCVFAYCPSVAEYVHSLSAEHFPDYAKTQSRTNATEIAYFVRIV